VTDLPRVLFVDDEQLLLDGLSRQVRGFVAAQVCPSPTEATRLLEQAVADPDGGYAAVVSDMRMPGMDGAALLKHARAVCPDTTRLLLTGYADIDSAIAAVNDGNLFRFLTKPCATPLLRAALTDAIEQHHLIRDRRQLLEQTLRGAVEALVETLAMSHPAAFARACRLRRLVGQVAEQLHLADRWQVEIAAQLGEIGVVTLPPEALEALTRGTPPNAAIARMLDALPGLADGVLRRVPRLETVRAIVAAQQPVDHAERHLVALSDRPSRILQAVREYDALTARGLPPDNSLGVLRQRGYHTDEILDALRAVVAADEAADTREVDVAYLRPGLVLAADLRSSKGMLLVSHGHVLTDELLTRIRNFARLSGLESKPLILEHGQRSDAPR